MAADIPKEFDVAIVGTGLVQTILAGAFARVDKTVFHVDKNSYYGETSTSFSLQELVDWTKESEEEGDEKRSWRNYTETPCPDELLKQSRSYSIDVCPRLLYSSGQLVNALAESGVHRYLEFKIVDGCYNGGRDGLQKAPTSKSDIFQSTGLSMVQKRQLMKFMQAVKEFDVDSEDGERSFVDFLESRKVPADLQDLLMYNLAFCSDPKICSTPMTTSTAIRRCRIYLESLGRFGDTPFIYPVFGVGELPQAFSRLCAVYGGIYMLAYAPKTLSTHTCDDGKVVATGFETPEGEPITAKHTVVGYSSCPAEAIEKARKTFMLRGICITDQSLKTGENTVLAVIPPSDSLGLDSPVRLLQLGSSTSSAPQGKYVVHFVAEVEKERAPEDLKPVVEQFWSRIAEQNSNVESPGTAERDVVQLTPSVLWSTYSMQEIVCPEDLKWENLYVAPESSETITFEDVIEKARSIFKQIFPEEEFLPLAFQEEQVMGGNGDEEDEGVTSQGTEQEHMSEDTAPKDYDEKVE